MMKVAMTVSGKVQGVGFRYTTKMVADQLGVSRQAIYDIIHRSEQVLLEYEQKLKLIERYHSEKNELKNILDIMSDLPKNVQDIPEFQDVLIKLSHLIGDSKEA